VNQAIQINSTSANAYDTRGWTKFAKGDKGGAVADCCRAVLLDRQGAVGYNSGGLLYYIAGEYGDPWPLGLKPANWILLARVTSSRDGKGPRTNDEGVTPDGHVLAAW